MKHEIAQVFDPSGKLLHEHPRANVARAVRSAKLRGIRTRNLGENEYDTVCEYEPGTRIVCGPVCEVWDGHVWAPLNAGGAL